MTAFSTSTDKESEAKELGAHHFVNTRDTGRLKKVTGSFDLLLSTVNADQEWAAYMNALRPNGVLCLVGAPPSAIPAAGGTADRGTESGVRIVDR